MSDSDFMKLDARLAEAREKLEAGDLPGAREVYQSVLTEVKALQYNGPGGSAEYAFDEGQAQRIEETQGKLAEVLAKEKEAFAAAEKMEACANPKCGCSKCTCGPGCTCGVSMEKTCDPCVEFKKEKEAAAAKA
mmetsp:Transcript_8183/g.16940  ORF Transcript_8183/g.16940 Transcript_8183/m.16940 type:complete len:134 (+) Transcript_8183:80-481(+)